jgi:hypothetical protein
LFRPKTAEVPEEELPKLALSDGSAPIEEKAAPPEHREEALYVEDSGLQPFPDHIEESSRPRVSLFVGSALLALVLAAGVTYAMRLSEKPVAMPPITAADPGPAKIVPSAAPADNDQQKKLTHDRLDGAHNEDQSKLVTPGNLEVAEVPASPGGDNNRVSRVIAPAGPGFDLRTSISDALPSADRPVTDVAAESDDNGHSPTKAGTLVVGSVVGSKTAAEADAGKLFPLASPVLPPPATPPADTGAASPSAHAPSGLTQMDAVINGNGSPIPINADPLGINGGDKAAADASAGAVPKRGRSPEPVGVAMSGATPAPNNGAAAADSASAVPAAPTRVPIPPIRPVFPNNAGRPLPSLPAVASSGDVY